MIMHWKTKDGREIPIQDLPTPHLTSIIAMLRRRGYVTPEEYQGLAAYARSSSTPDGAQLAAESELLSTRPWEVLKHLEEELHRR